MRRTMTRTVLVVCVVLVLLVRTTFAEITFEGETKVPAHSIAKVRAKSPDYKSFIFKVFDGNGRRVKTEKGEGGWLLFTGVNGTYRVEAVAGKTDKDGYLFLDEAEVTVTIGSGPDPGPDPMPPPDPTPDPKPNPAPINLPGFAVLMVYETKSATELPAGQQDVLFGKKVRDYLKANCLKDADNPTGAYRIYDKDIATDGEKKSWQDAMKRDRKSTPWIVISNSKTGYEGPLPKDADEAVALLARYTGKGAKR